MQFGKKLPMDTHTIFNKTTSNSRTFGKKHGEVRKEQPRINEQLYKSALFPENNKDLPQRSQLER
jgi:hypothetical protein